LATAWTARHFGRPEEMDEAAPADLDAAAAQAAIPASGRV
jgi:hypothetical protein